jgi:SWI/SNF-related matrix-associated actin-dependent regulator 1 of chromatin subfamily A
MDELQDILRANLMVRRLKKDVLSQLPEKQWHVFPIERKGAVAEALRHPGWAKAEALYKMDDHCFTGGPPIDGSISTARRLLGEAKAPIVVAYIADLFISGVEKLVVGAHHKNVIEILRKKLGKYNLVVMEGSMKKRQAAVDRFQNDPSVQIILAQNQILSLGHTLHAAQDVVLVEPDWVPGNNDQLLERVHRFGQTGSYVIGHVPTVPGTMDEHILGTTIRKARNIYAALDERHTT